MSKAVIPNAPETLMDLGKTPQPSRVTFLVHPWRIEMNHDMSDLQFHSHTPNPENQNEFVAHYWVESKHPRFTSFAYADAWIATNHKYSHYGPFEIHTSRCFFHPKKADDKLYFDSPPSNRIEIVADGFIEDREILRLLEGVVPREYEIRSLLQRQSLCPRP